MQLRRWNRISMTNMSVSSSVMDVQGEARNCFPFCSLKSVSNIEREVET